MKAMFTLRESSALYRLLADTTSDIILKTDRNGFIVHASPAIERLGISMANMLIGPHIRDLVHPACAAAIDAEHQAAIDGRQGEKWIEVPTLTSDGHERWYAIQMRRLVGERAQAYGALIIMRSIEDRRVFEEQLFAAAMTDPLTGLTNRTAFVAMLQHLLEQEVQGCLAIFAIDHFKAINMKHGQAVGDEVLVQFADIMRSRMRSTDIISRIGGESLAVMMPTASSEQTEALCQRLLDGLGDIRHGTGSSAFSITASAGVARIRGTLDDTIKRAEMALFFAKATGRNRLELDGELQPQRKRLTA